MEQKTKKDASKYLGVSERAIERYAVQGRLSVYQEKRMFSGKPRLINLYDYDELKKLKEEMQQPRQVRTASAPVGGGAVGMTRRHDGVSQLVGLLQELSEQSEKKPLSVPLSEKLSLTLSEASELSGYSESFLAAACRDNKLKAHKHGGWHITPDNLRAFIKKLHTM